MRSAHCYAGRARVAGHPAPATFRATPTSDRLGGIDEYRLDSNGLTVCWCRTTPRPVVTFQVTYQVGSRNEVTGTTGATHILEHMMFKGSDAYNDPKGNSIKQYLERVGGQFNASTSFDRTNYFATIGRDEPGGLHRHRGGSHASSVAARGRPAVGNDRGAQRVRARQERS